MALSYLWPLFALQSLSAPSWSPKLVMYKAFRYTIYHLFCTFCSFTHAFSIFIHRVQQEFWPGFCLVFFETLCLISMQTCAWFRSISPSTQLSLLHGRDHGICIKSAHFITALILPQIKLHGGVWMHIYSGSTKDLFRMKKCCVIRGYLSLGTFTSMQRFFFWRNSFRACYLISISC